MTLAGGASFDGAGWAALPNDNGEDSFLDLGEGFALAAANGFSFAVWARPDTHRNSARLLYLRDAGP